MIKIYNFLSLTDLAHKFSEIYSANYSDPLNPAWVIVQNNEVKEWLSLHLADSLGIAGNFRFIFPSEFLWTLYRIREQSTPKNLPSDLNSMQWALFQLFEERPELLSDIPFADTAAKSTSLKFQFCGQLADVFDQYQVYRPEMMQAWLKRNLVTKNAHEKWQAALWKVLNSTWNKNEMTSQIPTRAKAYDNLIDWIEGTDTRLLDKIPGMLFTFGLSHNSQPFLQILSKLAPFKDIHFFSKRVPENFGDESADLLFKKWRSSFVEQIELFKSFNKHAPDVLEESDLDGEIVSIPGIEVHSFHNERREVEVLKDSVLHFLNEHKEAGPQDILVMIPDAEEYASLLESIFTGVDEKTSLPISRLYDQLNPEEHTLESIFDLLSSSFKPSMVADIMNLNPIKNTFSFSKGELEVLEEWIIQNNVYRGLGDDFNELYSWKKGINQLLAGLSMEASDLDLYRGLVPNSSIITVDDMHLTARFSRFLHMLMTAADESGREKTPEDWLEFADKLIRDFIQDKVGDNNSSGLFSTLAKLKEQLKYSQVTNEVPYSLIKNWLKDQFSSNRSSSGRFGQGITVSSYIPYRSVPFKFIAVLGMNEGEFPRRSVRPEFDLIYADPKPGDRIQKEDDTFLFLETLLAAGNKLHISYKGRDQKSDSERLPSILVQQLEDVYQEEKLKKFTHSLHPFSPRYFKKEKLPASFSATNLSLANNIRSVHQETPEFLDYTYIQDDLKELKKLAVQDIILFFTDPCKYMARNYLNVSDILDETEIEDREAFDVGGLESYNLSDFLLRNIIQGYSKEEIYDYAHKSARIPDKLKGRKVFDEQYQEVQTLLKEMEPFAQVEPRDVEIELDIDGIEIYGRISNVYEDVLISSRVGRRRPKDEVEHWLRHLLLLKQGVKISESIFITKEKEGIEVFDLRSENISIDGLDAYIEWFLRDDSMLTKSAFFPETSKAYAESLLQGDDELSALDEARKVWEPGYHRSRTEKNEFYSELIWRGKDPLQTKAFKENAMTFWVPFLKAIEKEGDE
ncbi:MAG: exodeoxyribonuclease V subunit gamma [Gracilimonas sp.]